MAIEFTSNEALDKYLTSDQYRFVNLNPRIDLEVDLFGNKMLTLKVESKSFPTNPWNRFWMKFFLNTKFTKL